MKNSSLGAPGVADARKGVAVFGSEHLIQRALGVPEEWQHGQVGNLSVVFAFLGTGWVRGSGVEKRQRQKIQKIAPETYNDTHQKY